MSSVDLRLTRRPFARRLPPAIEAALIGALVGLVVLCAAGPPLTFGPLIQMYLHFGCKTALGVTKAYASTGLPVLHLVFGAAIGAASLILFQWLLLPRLLRPMVAAKGLRFLLGFVGIVITVAIVAFADLSVMSSWFVAASPRPTDEIYIATFPQNRRALEEIVSLLEADDHLGDIRTDVRWQAAEPDEVEQRKEAHYRELLQSLGAAQATVGLDGAIETRESSDGWLMSDSDDTGYCYAPPASERVLKSLNGMTAAYGVDYSAVRPISGKWYVYYRHVPGD